MIEKLVVMLSGDGKTSFVFFDIPPKPAELEKMRPGLHQVCEVPLVGNPRRIMEAMFEQPADVYVLDIPTLMMNVYEYFCLGWNTNREKILIRTSEVSPLDVEGLRQKILDRDPIISGSVMGIFTQLGIELHKEQTKFSTKEYQTLLLVAFQTGLAACMRYAFN